jgi:two-component system, chemotaxis family, chemotaxis protein CheY
VTDRQFQLKDLSALTILVVDDSAGMRQLLASVLQSLGLRHVQLADNGHEALALMRTTKQPDLCIVDWEMRPMDGLSLIKEIRKASNQQNAFVPIVVLTAHSSPQVVRAALANGANQFLTKPVVPQTLLNRILWALNDKRPFALRDGHFVHASKESPVAVAPAKPAAAIPKPTEMWEIE